MDWDEIPHTLVRFLAKLDIDWPEAKATSMIARAGDVVQWIQDAQAADQAAIAAADTMLATNHSGALTAFRSHFDSVAGSTGFMMRASVAEGATGLVLATDAALVLGFKLAIIGAATVLATTLPEAIAAFPEGLVAWGELARKLSVQLKEAETETIAAMGWAGEPLAQLAGVALDADIKHLDTRPIHNSPSGVHDYQDARSRQSAAANRQLRWDELSRDPDKNGAVDAKSQREATVALALEETGMFPPGSVRRPDKAGMGDFLVQSGGTQQAWDIKRVPSWTGPVPPDRKDLKKYKNAYTDAVATRLITEQLYPGLSGKESAPRNVVMDSSNLTDADRRSLIALVRSHPEWNGKVVVY